MTKHSTFKDFVIDLYSVGSNPNLGYKKLDNISKNIAKTSTRKIKNIKCINGNIVSLRDFNPVYECSVAVTSIGVSVSFYSDSYFSYWGDILNPSLGEAVNYYISIPELIIVPDKHTVISDLKEILSTSLQDLERSIFSVYVEYLRKELHKNTYYYLTQ